MGGLHEPLPARTDYAMPADCLCHSYSFHSVFLEDVMLKHLKNFWYWKRRGYSIRKSWRMAPNTL